jgi:ABC-type uncharacterized transport system involved in gliding motility auxiliary subunit
MASPKKPFWNESTITAALWIGLVVSVLGLMFAFAVFADLRWVAIVTGVLTAGFTGGLIYRYRKGLQTRAGAFGLYSTIISVLVFFLLGVINFISYRYPQKLDLTRSKQHTLNDQTVKVIQGLNRPVKAVLYAKFAQMEQSRALLNDLKGLNPKFEVEYVDPDKEPARAKTAGIKKYNTLQLMVDTRESKVEEPDEEKVLNALMKMLKDKAPSLCVVTGHGEHPFNGQEADGLKAVKDALEAQAYAVKDVSLLEGNAALKDCTGLVVAGATKAIFPQEVKVLKEYLANGGRMVLAYNLDPRAGRLPDGVEDIMKDWHLKPMLGLIIDPVSRMLGMDSSMPVIATFSKDSPITKDFQGNSFFPFATPIEIVSGAPSSMTVTWLGQTTPKSLLITDLKQLASGRVTVDPATAKAGPFNAAVAVEGKLKDSKAEKKSRLVVFGTSQFANNNFARYGLNLDFFVNAISWTLEDESVISVRKKEDEASRLELSSRTAGTVAIFSMVIIPLLVAAGGIVFWLIRRRM